jgi:hypothetical protein
VSSHSLLPRERDHLTPEQAAAVEGEGILPLPPLGICLGCGSLVDRRFVQKHREKCEQRPLDLAPLWELAT